jgi:hypothetical protein
MIESVQVNSTGSDVGGSLADIVAEITDRLHAGERVALEECLHRHPELADRMEGSGY